MASEIIKACSKLIAQHKLKIAFAESATAGWLTSEFALTPDSGKVLLGGLVCYDACTKQELFGISQEMIDEYTPESAEVTKALAEGLGKYYKGDIAVAVTGLTAPGGSETEDKPVGTMFIHITMPNDKYCAHREVFKGNDEAVIKQAIDRTGELIMQLLNDNS